MKGLALGIAALGICLASAAPSLAHEHRGGYWYGPAYHYHGGYYRSYAPVVVAPAPVYGYAPAPTYGYAGYPPYATVAPAYPPVAPYPAAVPGAYYAPSVSLGYRGRGFAVGVGL